MKKVFVAYGNDLYTESLQRIEVQAKDTGCFDEVLIYQPKDLPECITNKGYQFIQLDIELKGSDIINSFFRKNLFYGM